MLLPHDKHDHNTRPPIDGESPALPARPICRSLSTEIPFALVVKNVTESGLGRLVAEIFPTLPADLVSALFTVVEEGGTIRGSALRSSYFNNTPLSIHQKRVFNLSNRSNPQEFLHATTIIDERAQPEHPTLEIFKLHARHGEISLRIRFDALSHTERWPLVNALCAMHGLTNAAEKFVNTPADDSQGTASSSSWTELTPTLLLESLSTLDPLPLPHNVHDRPRAASDWSIRSIEYSEPSYSEQATILRAIDPKEFTPQEGRNLLSSLLLHVARAFVRGEDELVTSKLERASKHIEGDLSVSFERRVALGDPDLEEEFSYNPELYPDCAEEDDPDSWEPPPDLDECETPQDGDFSLVDALFESAGSDGVQHDSNNESQISGDDEIAEEHKDSGTLSFVKIEQRTGRYGQYRLTVSTEALSNGCDQVNDDSQFNQAATTLRIDFLDEGNTRARWNLIPKLFSHLDDMQVPDDEAYSLDTIQRDFQQSDAAASHDELTLYLGRLRITATRQ